VQLEKKRRITPDREMANSLPLNMPQSESKSSAGFKDAVRTKERRLASRVTSMRQIHDIYCRHTPPGGGGPCTSTVDTML
jgi:hypothetical protein